MSKVVGDLILLFWISSFTPIFASVPTIDWGVWQEAQALYDSGKYEEAIKSFKANPSENGNYYYNLGAAYFQLGKTGIATAYFEKANSLKPHDPDIQHNLSAARTSLAHLMGEDHLDPASSGLESLADHIPLNEVRGTMGLLGLILSLLWAHRYYKTHHLKKTLLQPTSLIVTFAFSLTVGLYVIQRLASLNPPAICVEQALIRSGPGDHFLQLTQMEAGTKVRLSSATNPTPLWRQVRYSPDEIGWIRESSLLLL